MDKMRKLKMMLVIWKRTKDMTLAHDICEFLADNLDMEAK